MARDPQFQFKAGRILDLYERRWQGQRALALAGADIRADPRHRRRAEAEDERDQQILESSPGAKAGDRARAVVSADQRGGKRDCQRVETGTLRKLPVAPGRVLTR